ncbi:SUKH-4 family immunity protein [Streptomyces sp. NPDC005435]|uniref:SUKH-4 family immunity protein n=1 Tax=Streptomyces sp. NPDC005435 TaxID=3154464 RepID=UPI0034531D4F
MLFDVTHSELVGIFGEDRIATVPATAFAPAVADTEGARFLESVGVPTGTLVLRQPEEAGGRLPLVRDAVPIEDFEDAPEGAGGWPVIGWLLNAHLALDPGSGRVYAFDADEQTAQDLHTDVSSLAEVTLRLQRLLDEFTFDGDDEEAGFERLEGDVDRIREDTSAVDPLPFRDDETVWSVVADEIAMGQRFTAESPGGRSLYG